jgi:hypothetical protein
MLYDSNGFKPYIFFVCQKLSMCHTYKYYIGTMPKSMEFQFFKQFLKFPELPSQFSPDMSGLFSRNIWLAEHVRIRAWTCPGFGFPAYIRGMSAPP